MEGMMNLLRAFRSVFSLERLYWAVLYYVIAQGALMAFIQFQVQILGNDVSVGSSYSKHK